MPAMNKITTIYPANPLYKDFETLKKYTPSECHVTILVKAKILPRYLDVITDLF